MNKTKLKDGFLKIGSALLAFSAPALGLLVAIVFLAVASVIAYSIIMNEGVSSDLKRVVGLAVLALSSISLTQWILIVLVWMAFGIDASNRKILSKLGDIESELNKRRSSVLGGSVKDEDFNDS